MQIICCKPNLNLIILNYTHVTNKQAEVIQKKICNTVNSRYNVLRGEIEKSLLYREILLKGREKTVRKIEISLHRRFHCTCN